MSNSIEALPAIDVVHLRLQRLLAREGQQLLGQGGAAVDGAPHAVEGTGVGAGGALQDQHL